jgi:hypothetical protein
MAIYRFAKCMRGRDFFITSASLQHTGKVHHFAQVFDLFSFQQFFYGIAVQAGAGCFKNSGGYTARGAEIEFERNLPAIFDHEVNTFQSAYIRYLMRIAYSTYAAMHYRQPGKFTGDEHAAFNMHMAVYKTRHQEGQILLPARFPNG